ALGSEDCDCETRSHQLFGVYKGLVHGKFAELTARWLVGYGTFEREMCLLKFPHYHLAMAEYYELSCRPKTGY
ncbi:hypothetical protein AVEN_257145-1, partial [Araneus ventricosus]